MSGPQSRRRDVNGALLQDAIIDYCFGAHPNDTHPRKLYLQAARVTPKFLERLVETSRKCQLTHSVSLNLSNMRYTELTLDVASLAEYGSVEAAQGMHVWNFAFPDLPRFHLTYVPEIDYVRCRMNSDEPE